MDGDFTDRSAGGERHDISRIPQHLTFVRGKWGETGVQEFLYHIKDDYKYRLDRYERNPVLRLFGLLYAIVKMTG